MATDYIVFHKTMEGWEEVGGTQADNASGAIKTAADSSGSYVAIPKRSFKPIQVVVETTSRVKIVSGGEQS